MYLKYIRNSDTFAMYLDQLVTFKKLTNVSRYMSVTLKTVSRYDASKNKMLPPQICI